MTIDTIAAASAARIDKNYPSAEAAIARPQTARSANTGIDATANKAKEPSREELDQAVSELNQSPQVKTQGLQFSIDEDSQRTVVKVIDQETQEVLRQIPTREALEIAKSFASAKGQLISQSV
ncbi:flagellar protein FlaG [Janthinobacterium lividum]|jgi:flagellar protein FlaG|uniref:flagellar protein FlaG n=1 Tax=unclassified Janthinobacterium TaxID=2610881 RepID=UPI000874DA5C|nr:MULTISPECIES: flagellar protein FlaG [unclassified Janthinobacterium]MCC7695898.1 flagellar protein FlaG [Janthinobacterium sp. EB271-G4-7A]OEZ47257.1 flagellar protein FlaG [Janthinobacterium sp. MP5059B]PHV24111.1 flagellar biosynthesis protein FlaG [Janthinobacterium sp. BJB446]PHV48723.1 flagellar biosynthesis protein FlaG [Janthinobacterium sp. BJB301]SDH27695.1 flagellar protein FlaG [Janthinobacterium sp. YR213]